MKLYYTIHHFPEKPPVFDIGEQRIDLHQLRQYIFEHYGRDVEVEFHNATSWHDEQDVFTMGLITPIASTQPLMGERHMGQDEKEDFWKQFWTAELQAILTPGKKARFVFAGGKVKKVIHIRAIVDGQVIVYRWWSPYTGWRYEAQNIHYFWLAHKDGVLVKAK